MLFLLGLVRRVDCLVLVLCNIFSSGLGDCLIVLLLLRVRVCFIFRSRVILGLVNIVRVSSNGGLFVFCLRLGLVVCLCDSF